MARYGLPDSAWVKSSYGGDNGGSCVETQPTPGRLWQGACGVWTCSATRRAP
ncbi:DUF397 domain-containing protein [Streptomyces sp. SM11]|uniref:DUF397 domain-containing protein n=1 Tax=Streptomyces sp. SM11 TaxID=565557 RepID=UPI000CD5C7AB|nr:DUF397 domain-containing protein [Streptomyces sp. SM11]